MKIPAASAVKLLTASMNWRVSLDIDGAKKEIQELEARTARKIFGKITRKLCAFLNVSVN